MIQHATHPRSLLMDSVNAADAILNRALACCLDEIPLKNQAALVECLRQGNHTANSRYKHNLAQQMAEHLGMCDDDVKVVYIYDHDIEDTHWDEEWSPLIVHLIVWAQPKTAALNSLIAALNRALTRCYGDLIGDLPPVHLLDVQVIDDVEVKNRAGYASLLFSPHFRPLVVWKREPDSHSNAIASPQPRSSPVAP